MKECNSSCQLYPQHMLWVTYHIEFLLSNINSSVSVWVNKQSDSCMQCTVLLIMSVIKLQGVYKIIRLTHLKLMRHVFPFEESNREDLSQ